MIQRIASEVMIQMLSPAGAVKLQKILAYACNAAVSPDEAKSYAGKAGAILSNAGLSFEDITFGVDQREARVREAALSSQLSQLARTILELKRENVRLAAEAAGVEAMRREIRRLRSAETRLSNKIKKVGESHKAVCSEHQKLVAEHERLKRQNEASHSAHAGSRETGVQSTINGGEIEAQRADVMTYSEFAEEAERKFGRKHFKSAFAFHSGLSIKQMNAYQTAGVIPMGMVSVLRAMTDEQCKPASRKRWREGELDQLEGLLNRGESALSIAKTLSFRFGRPVYETSIVGKRRRLVRERSWTAPPRRSECRRSTAFH
jgi:hypothetical protein